MKSEELAAQWCRDHPDATLEQAFMAGLGHKMNMNKDSLSARKDKFRSEVLMYRGKYPDDMLKDFFEYWTECGGGCFWFFSAALRGCGNGWFYVCNESLSRIYVE